MTEKLVIRQRDDGTEVQFYASIFNQKSNPIFEGGKRFLEVINPNAFDNADMSNVIATLFHDPNKILGRVKADTLKLTTDDYGLLATVQMGNTTLHKDTLEQIERGDLFESSFIAVVSDYKDTREDGLLVRYINKVDKVKDVSIVGDGAYSDTNIIIREMAEDAKKVDEVDELEALKLENEKLKAELEAKKEAERAEEPKPEEAPKEEEAKPEPEVKPEPEQETKPEVKEENADEPKEEVKRSLTPTKEETKMNFVDEIKRSLDSRKETVIELERAAGDGESANFTNITPVVVGDLSVVGKAPVWQKLGMDILTGAQGTFTYAYEDPTVGAKLAEIAAVTGQVETDDGTLVKAQRFQVEKTYTKETLKSISPEALAKQMQNLEAGCDRKITEYAFTKALAGATADLTVTGISELGIDKLSGAVDSDMPVSLMMSRTNFYAKKSVKVDGGSGINLMTIDGEFGKTWEGRDVFFSALFADDTQYLAGDMSQLLLADFGGAEILVDPYTKASTGQVVITFTKMAEIIVKNPAGFKKSGTLV
jgi:HK97 family phage prohead protease